MTATAPPLTERQFQRQVTELAELLGYEWVHFRPAQTERGWRTPVSGTLGKGWVDLILVRERDRRLLFVELKAEKGKLTFDQIVALGVLKALERDVTQIAVYVWRPSDFDDIERILR